MNSKENKEKYMQAFSALHSTREINIEKKSSKRMNPVYAYGLALVVAVGCAAAAISNLEVIKEYLSWGNNASVSIVKEEDGSQGTLIKVNTEKMSTPAEVRDGRLYFTAYEENIDITDMVSVDKAYIYKHEQDGQTSYIAIGLNDSKDINNFGFAEYFKTENGTVGYSAMTNTESDGSGLPWLENAKKELGVD